VTIIDVKIAFYTFEMVVKNLYRAQNSLFMFAIALEIVATSTTALLQLQQGHCNKVVAFICV
tara:strand:+ start:8453 stop:8638 length:186 start_codon:yes stop_codon:yes gene_type:complete